jgi:hypothetical protein
MITLFFQPNIIFPISLMELDLYTKNKKLIICYFEGFWRKGNIQIVCKIFRISFIEIKEKLTELIKKRLENIIEKYDVPRIHDLY